MADATTTTNSGPEPVILDLGKRKRKRVKQLRKGAGPLMADVMDSVDQLKAAGQVDGSAQTIVVVVREKSDGNTKMKKYFKF